MYESKLIHHIQSPQPVHAPATTADAFSREIRPPLPNTNASIVAAPVMESVTGQQRKSQNSLLDDVEETLMEKRMRSLHQYA
jgi:hypothetical protein